MSASLTGPPPPKPVLVAPPGVRRELTPPVSAPPGAVQPSAPTPAPKPAAPAAILTRFTGRPKPIANILICGESGWGKTHSMQNMPWERTAYIDTEGKGFGWSERVPSDRLFRVADALPDEILALIDAVKEDPRFDYVVIDSFTGFSNRAFSHCATKYGGYDIYTTYSKLIAQFLERATSATKRMIVTAIPEILTAESAGNTVGVLIKRAAVIGRAMEGKVEPAFAYAVFLRQIQLPNQPAKSEFILTSDMKSQAKVPEGVFKPTELSMPNDTWELIKRIEAAERAVAR